MARSKKIVESQDLVLPKETILDTTVSNEVVVEKNGVKVIQWTDENGVTFVKPL